MKRQTVLFLLALVATLTVCVVAICVPTAWTPTESYIQTDSASPGVVYIGAWRNFGQSGEAWYSVATGDRTVCVSTATRVHFRFSVCATNDSSISLVQLEMLKTATGGAGDWNWNYGYDELDYLRASSTWVTVGTWATPESSVASYSTTVTIMPGINLFRWYIVDSSGVSNMMVGGVDLHTLTGDEAYMDDGGGENSVEDDEIGSIRLNNKPNAPTEAP